MRRVGNGRKATAMRSRRLSRRNIAFARSMWLVIAECPIQTHPIVR